MGSFKQTKSTEQDEIYFCKICFVYRHRPGRSSIWKHWGRRRRSKPASESSCTRSQCQVSYRVHYYMGHRVHRNRDTGVHYCLCKLSVHSTESSVPMYPNKNVELYKIANAVQCTMKYV